MKQALESLLADSKNQAMDSLANARPFLSHLVRLFEQKDQSTSASSGAAPPPIPELSSSSSLVPVPSASPAASMLRIALTRREQEILRLLAAGASNHEIAHTLVIELSTAKKHVSNLLGKLGATSRSQVVAQARALSPL